jgi:rod shape-determining protein MreC
VGAQRYGCHSVAALENIGSYIAYPILQMGQYAIGPVRTFFAKKETERELRAIIANLSEKNTDLRAYVTQLRGEKIYIDDIKELVQFRKRYVYDNALLVRITVKILSPEEHIFFINAGSCTGVEKDMVAVHKNHIIGRVHKVYPRYSKIILITDKRCKIAAECYETRVRGIAEGMNSCHITQLTHVSHSAPVHKGDALFSTGEGLIFPQGFSLGQVKAVVPGQLLQTIYVEPLAQLDEIDYCYLIKKGQEVVEGTM